MITPTFKPEVVRCVPAHVDFAQLASDLADLREKALAKGAGACERIKRTDVLFSPDVLKQVAADKRLPSAHWPIEYPIDDLNAAIDAYEWALFFQLPIEPEFPDYGGGPIDPPEHRQRYIKTHEIVSFLESSAFYMGYHLAIGLASGNCRAVFCPEEKRCPATIKGRTCIRPNMGRPSMAAAGIDARAMARTLNWEIPANNAPFLGGLVMIH